MHSIAPGLFTGSAGKAFFHVHQYEVTGDDRHLDAAWGATADGSPMAGQSPPARRKRPPRSVVPYLDAGSADVLLGCAWRCR